nr:PX domain-containing protein EREL2-like isoform X1 [Coffea arabica]
MQQRKSPPKHRHDGTSPLPLGMDWSPPPKKWAGRETVWPHDPHTGWSYCVTIPSWVVRPKSRDSDPIVFYRVLIGIQSPEGVTTTRYVLRRFNDFLKFLSALKTAFPRKNLPSAPPKGLLRMKTRALLEERRRSLEEWMTKLLSDIDISRSFVVASFLELEAAARSSFQDENQHSSVNPSGSSSTNSSSHVHPNSSLSLLAGSSSIMSDYGSDTAYETSEIGSGSLGLDNNSEIGTEDLSLDEDLSSPIDKFMKYGMSNIDEGLFMGQAILEQLEGFPRQKVHVNQNAVANDIRNENGFHARKSSADSIGSEVSSKKGSQPPNLAFSDSLGNGSIHLPGGASVSGTTEVLGNSDLQLPDDVQLVLPQDQGQKMNRVLMTMHRRLVAAKTDMEDLISRLNQEIAVKEYLTTKVKDLEVELETTKQKSKENIEQAILIEQERVTQMQWDMEELRRKSMEMELKLNSQQNQKMDTEVKVSSSNEKNILQELDLKRQQLEDLSKRQQEVEVKSKADIRVLVKEVKSLRSTQAEIKMQLKESLQEKSEIEMLLQEEKHKNEHMYAAWRNFLEKCETLFNQLQECKVDILKEDEKNDLMEFPLPTHAFDDIAKSDDQINVLLAEVQHLSLAVDALVPTADKNKRADDDMIRINEHLRTMLVNFFVDNGRLIKQVNYVARALRMKMSADRNDSEACPNNCVKNEGLDR